MHKKFKNNIHSALAILLMLTAAPLATAQEASTKEEYRLATDIADHYTKSFPSERRDAGEVKAEKEQAAHESRPAKLTEKTKREVVFNCIFTKSERYALLQQSMAPLLNEYAWGDLHLFYGTTSQPAYHLMSRINRTLTTLGEGVLATLLVTPTSNIAELKQRQQIIQAFLENKAETTQLRESLQRYQDSEQSVLSLWTSTDPLYTKEYQKYMNDYFYAKNDAWGNKNAGWLEFKKRFFRDFWSIQYKFLWPVTLPTISEMVASKAMSRTNFFFQG